MIKEFENILQISDIDKKQEFIDKYLKILKEKIDIKKSYTPIIFDNPSYATFTQIVNPRNLPNRKDFDTKEG